MIEGLFKNPNPILYKELVQGMRSKAFLGMFLITQLVMVVVTMGIVGSEAGSSNNSEKLTAMFWGALAIPFLIFQPLLAIESINSEVKLKTLEMLYLSRLSARRIVLGKFYSHLLQTLMVACTILPYVVLRYFAGGVNLVIEFSTLISIVLISSLGTALSVSASSFSVRSPKSHRARILLLFIFLVFGSTTGLGAFTAFMRFGGGGNINWIDFTSFLLMMPFVIYQVLSLGMSQVAPLSENNLLHKRLNCFAVLCVYLLCRYFCESPLILFPLMICFLMSAFEGVFTGDANYRSSYDPVKHYPRLALLMAPNRYAYFNWFNFAVLLSILMLILEVSHTSFKGLHKSILLLGPIILCLIYFGQMQLAQVKKWSGINSFFVVFLLPFILFMGMVFCDTLDEFINNDAYEIFALCYVLYANIMISYGFAIQIAKWKKENLNTLHYVISFTGLIIAGTISLILKSILTRDLDDLLALFPLELFPVMLDNNQEKGIALSFIVHFQLLLSLFTLNFMASKSAEKFFEFKSANTSKKIEIDTDIPMTVEEA